MSLNLRNTILFTPSGPAPTIVTDRPGTATAAGAPTALVLDRVLTDRPGAVAATGGRDQIAGSPVTITDRPSAVHAAAPVAAVAVRTYTGTTANGDPWKLWVPATTAGATSLVHFASGYGGSYLDPDSAQRPLRDAVLAAGWAMVAASYSLGAPDRAWGAGVIAGGNQRAVETCFMQADAAAKAIVVAPVTLVTRLAVGQSMGLINLIDAFRYETGITTVVGLYGIHGVYSLAALYAGSHGPHIDEAYNIPTGGDYATQTAGRDPNLATAAQNAGPSGAVRFRYSFSAGDTVCRPDQNAAPFVTSFAGLAGVVEASAVVAPDNATHLNGFAESSAGAADFVAFGQRAIVGTDATAAAVPAGAAGTAGTLTAGGRQITWPDPAVPSRNLAGWNVYVNGVKKNTTLIPRDITGTWLRTKGNTAASTTWTDTVNAPFTALHVGQPFYGTHVPPGTAIAALISPSQVTLSQATTNTDNTLSRLRYVAPLPLYTITGLTANTTYTVTLRSVTYDGVESADSSSLTFTTADAPTAVTATGPGQTLAIDRIVTDRPGAITVSGSREQVAVSTIVTDRPGATFAAGLRQTLVVDRVLTDRSGAPTATGGREQVTSTTTNTDRPGVITATGGREQAARGVTLADRPGAVATGTPRQIVLVEVIRPDRPVPACAAGTPTLPIADLTLTDYPYAVLAVGPSQQVTTTPALTGWPPVVTGPFTEPLFLVTAGL